MSRRARESCPYCRAERSTRGYPFLTTGGSLDIKLVAAPRYGQTAQPDILSIPADGDLVHPSLPHFAQWLSQHPEPGDALRRIVESMPLRVEDVLVVASSPACPRDIKHDLYRLADANLRRREVLAYVATKARADADEVVLSLIGKGEWSSQDVPPRFPLSPDSIELLIEHQPVAIPKTAALSDEQWGRAMTNAWRKRADTPRMTHVPNAVAARMMSTLVDLFEEYAASTPNPKPYDEAFDQMCQSRHLCQGALREIGCHRDAIYREPHDGPRAVMAGMVYDTINASSAIFDLMCENWTPEVSQFVARHARHLPQDSIAKAAAVIDRVQHIDAGMAVAVRRRLAEIVSTSDTPPGDERDVLRNGKWFASRHLKRVDEAAFRELGIDDSNSPLRQFLASLPGGPWEAVLDRNILDVAKTIMPDPI